MFNFFETMMSNFLLPLITIPTKIHSGNNTLIDNIFTNHLHPDMISGHLTVGISDHLPSFMTLHKTKIIYLKRITFTVVQQNNLTEKTLYLTLLILIGTKH